MGIDRDYLIFYILSLIFCIATLCFGVNNLELIEWILILLIGTTINIMAGIHFYSPKN